VPFVEDNACDRPLAPYPASKRAAELAAHTYHHLYGLDCVNLRFFTVYGPRGRPDMMAYKVADSIYLGQEVPLFNGGQMYRDWTYVTDIVQGVVGAVDRGSGFMTVNLGRGEPVLLADFVAMIEEFTGKKARFRSEPMPAADVRYTFADITRARDLLGYEPKVSVAEGVRSFLDWYQATVHKSDGG
jgi:UDP-glucuronate 4-epimerase